MENNIEIIKDILNAYALGSSLNPDLECMYMYTIDNTRNGLPIFIVKAIYDNDADIDRTKELNVVKYGASIATYAIHRKNLDYNELISDKIEILYDKTGELNKLRTFIQSYNLDNQEKSAIEASSDVTIQR